jgi:hypothetical protein
MSRPCQQRKAEGAPPCFLCKGGNHNSRCMMPCREGTPARTAIKDTSIQTWAKFHAKSPKSDQHSFASRVNPCSIDRGLLPLHPTGGCAARCDRSATEGEGKSVAQYASRKGYRHLLVGPLTLEELDRATCQTKGCHVACRCPRALNP